MTLTKVTSGGIADIAAGVTTFGGWAEERDGSQSLSQKMFIYPLIKAIQELSAKNDALEARITTLEG